MDSKIISNILVDELCYVYCNDCKFRYNDDNIDSPCDDCHRKHMNWALSQEAAEAIANKILKALQE